MSWFGETFGDSLNSLKGQITKITKEVLADDEVSNDGTQEPENQFVRELKALCESKDIEIASLREELNNLSSQLLKVENLGEESGISCSDHDSYIRKLENELDELRQERDHLSSCIEELQAEHQMNLDQVISIKDKFKSDLQDLKKEYNDIKIKLDNSASNLNDNIEYDKCNNEISLLKTKIDELQFLLEKQKENSIITIKKEVEAQTELKEKLDKLSAEIQVISRDKNIIEAEKETFKKENEDLRNKLIKKEQESAEDKFNLKLLINEKAELIKKCSDFKAVESEVSSLNKVKSEIQQKLHSLSQILNLEIKKETDSVNNIIELMCSIESKVHKMCKDLNEKTTNFTNNLEMEFKNLKEDNKNFQNKLKIETENAAEMEKKYQEEILLLKNSLSELKTQEQDCINHSQTDDVKRLEQEVAQCMNLILAKNTEINNYSKLLSNTEQELKSIKSSSCKIEDELLAIKESKKLLEEETINLKNKNAKISGEKAELEERLKILESKEINLKHVKEESQKTLDILEKEIEMLKSECEKNKVIREELEKAATSKNDLEKKLSDFQNENIGLKNELKHLKAEVIIKESSLADLMKANTYFQEEINKLQAQNDFFVGSEREVKKWKDASVDLQIQLDDVSAKKEELENECLKFKNELKSILSAKNAEIQQLKLTNSNLMKSYNELYEHLQNKTQEEHFLLSKDQEIDERYQKQAEMISQLQEENSELKSRIQKFQEQMKVQMFQSQNQTFLKDDTQQHRRSKSAVDTESLDGHKTGVEEVMLLKQSIQQEQARYQLLLHQFQETANKEANARKEFERLKKHLIEVEDHYTEEAVENEKMINDLKSKLVAAEEQLQNSSTLYTSLKVRDNQHLESLQSQIRMVSVQRDDFQAKVSAAEDEIQKHKASLISLQIVLEQFQQDKERELEEVAMKYEKQLKHSADHIKNLESEIHSLKNQLAEAKNGLKAASRLGEQLEKKTTQVTDLEEQLMAVSNKVVELENSLSSANQVNNGKIDKSLIKNLVVGYVLSANADRKSQVLRIMASVLDFDQDERNKMGVDTTRSGWLSNILHPKGDAPPNSQSLSEAFIRFLESESRPQPQLKLLPEQLEASTSKKNSRASPKPSGRLTELTLPTFNSSLENESSIILKNVLKDS